MHKSLGRSCRSQCPSLRARHSGRSLLVPRAITTQPPTGRPGRVMSPTPSEAAAFTPRDTTRTTALPAEARSGTPGDASPGPSTASSSTPQGVPPKRQRRRLVLSRELPTINWDRFELGVFRRLEELEKAAAASGEGDGEGEGEDEDKASPSSSSTSSSSPSSSPSTSTSWFGQRLAASDLNAAYFRRWDDPAVHQPMLQDRVLLAAWRDALSAAPPGSLEGRTVLDVGCGLGWLSMLAAKAGAARVIAVDGSAGAVEAARRIVRANGLEDRVTVVHGAMEDLTELPGGVAPGEVDVVLSNWMGPGLLAGGMAASLAHAVSTWLRPGGLVLPDRVLLWAAALEDRDALQESKDTWSRVAGLDLTAALAQVIKHPRRDVLTRKSQLLSAPQLLAEWRTADLRPETVVEPQTGAYAVCPLKLAAVRDERLFGLVLYWEAHWTFGGALEGEDKSPVRFTTHPLASTTHYQQLMLNFPRSVRVAVDDEITGQVVLRPGSTDPRDVELEVDVTTASPSAPETSGKEPITATYRVSHLA